MTQNPPSGTTCSTIKSAAGGQTLQAQGGHPPGIRHSVPQGVEKGICNHEAPSWLEHPMNLCQDDINLFDVGQHLGSENDIETRASKRVGPGRHHNNQQIGFDKSRSAGNTGGIRGQYAGLSKVKMRAGTVSIPIQDQAISRAGRESQPLQPSGARRYSRDTGEHKTRAASARKDP